MAESPTVHLSYSRMESAACAWEFLKAYSYEGLTEHLFQCFAILQPKVYPMCNLDLFHCNLESLFLLLATWSKVKNIAAAF